MKYREVLDDDEISKYNATHMELASMISMAGLDSRQIFSEMARKTLMKKVDNGDPSIAAYVGDICNNKIRAERRRIEIIDTLPADQMANILQCFPEFSITFNGQRRHTHAMAAVVRRLMTEIILQRYSYDRKAYRDMKKTVLVDLGGNYVNYARDGCLDIHCCSPIIDHRDSARENERSWELQMMVNSKRGRKKITPALRNRYLHPERPLRSGQLNVRCKNLCQDCDVKAPAGFSIHGTYDMRMTELLQSLDSHGMSRFSVLIHFDMDILMSDEGVMQNLNCKFKKYVDDDGTERISFNFVGDTSTGYVHRLDTYMSLLFVNIAVSPKGIAYQFERGDSRCGSMIINITRCDAKPMIDKCHYYFSHWGHVDERVVVRTWKFVTTWHTQSPKVCMRRKNITCDKKLWENIVGQCNRSDDVSFNLNSLYSSAQSFNTRVVINGADVYAREPLSSDDLMCVVVAAYIMSYRLRWESGMVVKIATGYEKEKRASGNHGFLSLLFLAFGEQVLGFFDSPISILDSCKKQLAVFISLRKDTRKASCFNFDVDSTISVVDVSEMVEVCATYVPDVEKGMDMMDPFLTEVTLRRDNGVFYETSRTTAQRGGRNYVEPTIYKAETVTIIPDDDEDEDHDYDDTQEIEDGISMTETEDEEGSKENYSPEKIALEDIKSSCISNVLKQLGSKLKKEDGDDGKKKEDSGI
jgi:hypothetical protein